MVFVENTWNSGKISMYFESVIVALNVKLSCSVDDIEASLVKIMFVSRRR